MFDKKKKKKELVTFDIKPKKLWKFSFHLILPIETFFFYSYFLLRPFHRMHNQYMIS